MSNDRGVEMRIAPGVQRVDVGMVMRVLVGMVMRVLVGMVMRVLVGMVMRVQHDDRTNPFVAKA